MLAQDDESALQFPLPDHIFGFHAQQSCEKLMKALISSHNRKYPFTHNLQDLADLLADCNEVLPPLSFSLKQLEPFGVKLRYDLGAKLTDAERLAMRESVAQLREHVVARILELERPPGP
jgi:predicted RecB family nuclease